MSSGGPFWDIFARWAVMQSPLYVVLLCGFLLAVIRRQRHPRVSLFVALGTGLLLTNYAGGFAFNLWLRSQMGGGVGSIQTILSVVGIAQSLVSAAGFALLIAAAFVERVRPYDERPLEMRERDGR